MTSTRVLHRAGKARELLGGISKPTLYKWLNDGKLKGVKMGSALFIPDDEIRRFTEALPEYVPQRVREVA